MTDQNSNRAAGRTTVAVMQPYFFPYLPYFQLISAVDIFVYFDDVQFIRRGWINRNRILLNGEAHQFSIPVQKGKREDLICEKRLSAEAPAELERLRTKLAHAYKAAPFGAQTLQLFDRVTAPARDGENLMLLDLLISSIETVAHELAIKTKFRKASEFSLPPHLKGQERILEIAARLNAGRYLNPIGGKELYSADAFAAAGIELGFIESDPAISYPQIGGGGFVPHLSILDQLCHLGPSGTAALLGRWRPAAGSAA